MQDACLTPAIIVDLDETLAHLNCRDPWDATTCEEDLLNEPVAEMVRCYQAAHPDHRTIVITGRPEKHRHPTQSWLSRHGIAWSKLYMRDDDDQSSAAFFKWRVYKLYIDGLYKVIAVFDDNPTVCRMFAEQGLTVFRVGDQAQHFKD